MSRLIPRGVAVAGLGRRFAAALIDALPVALVSGLIYLALLLDGSPTVRLVAAIVGGVLVAGYSLYQWWAYASRGAGIGARAMGLQLVGLRDGEPIGWWRFFLRQLVFAALMVTVVGGIALLVFLVIHERRQGWHDMVGGAIVVQPKTAEKKAVSTARKVPVASTVGLPPHLSSTFSPQPGSTQSWDAYAPQASTQASAPSAPEWLPGVQHEPLPQQAPYSQPSAAERPQPSVQQSPFPQPSASQPPASQWSAPHQPQAAQPVQQWSAPEPQWQQSAPSAPASAGEPSIRDDFPSPRPTQDWIPLPTPSSVIESGVRVRRREFGEVDDDEGTRIANIPTEGPSGRPGGEGWYVRLDDGREVDLTATVLLGRNPKRGPSDPEEVNLVPASGDGRMISRTHVTIGTDPRGVYVVDRGSTNGTALVASGGDLEPCPADTQVRVREGQQVSYGNRWFTVLRRPEKML